jgi:hypothetical protein
VLRSFDAEAEKSVGQKLNELPPCGRGTVGRQIRKEASMTRKYPRRYAVVEKGKTKEVKVENPVHEVALLLSHQEAMGLNKPEPFDNSRFLIKEK